MVERERRLNPLLQYWVGPGLPGQHVFVDLHKRPRDFRKLTRLYVRKWLVHPLKRHLTHHYGGLLQREGCKVVTITGSAGKTTTKEMVASVLEQRYVTRRSRANIDPVYNIPETVLNSGMGTQRLVLEMGVEFRGEMDFYTWMVRPDIAVVTSIYWVHTQHLGNIDGVKQEKGKMLESLGKGGKAVLNLDDRHVAEMASKTNLRVMWYGLGSGADIKGKNLTISDSLRTRFDLSTDQGEINVDLPFLGFHFVPLALAAATVGVLNGIGLESIKKGLEVAVPSPHRMIPLKLADRVVIDDTYNANPLASIEAIKTLVAISASGRRILIMGEMKELGDYEEAGHREVGRFAAASGVDVILAVGNVTRPLADEARKTTSKIAVTWFEDKQRLISELGRLVEPGDLILVKGSRAMKMEDVVNALVLKT